MPTSSAHAPKLRSAIIAALIAVPTLLAGCSTDAPAPAPPAPGSEKPQATPEQVSIEESMPVEMTLPALGLHEPVVEDLCPMTDRGLDPVHLMDVCFYTADDKPYVLPSTDQKDVAVMAGHANTRIPGVFDDVFDAEKQEFNVKIGDELRVRTKASGSKWLVYKATDFHTPTKEDLAIDDEVWGSEPTPGRLLLLTCLRAAEPDAPALHNAVVGYQFDRVEDDGGMGA
ncbi:sortase domain-bontaining protein [Corynebacterium hansenii]|uniref:Sortase domain-bontaining protein n=1 Tax=Corynebacterium hansenii TaxID=394964 RepID=A0ABV7ZJ18_9CORY|nr:sortase [Corynebacterium hansenii]WJY99617.1 Sortase family protein [Corynebacterium hansenii]